MRPHSVDKPPGLHRRRLWRRQSWRWQAGWFSALAGGACGSRSALAGRKWPHRWWGWRARSIDRGLQYLCRRPGRRVRIETRHWMDGIGTCWPSSNQPPPHLQRTTSHNSPNGRSFHPELTSDRRRGWTSSMSSRLDSRKTSEGISMLRPLFLPAPLVGSSESEYQWSLGGYSHRVRWWHTRHG